MMIVVKALVVWGMIALLAIINGGFREAVLNKRLPPTAALMVSGVLLMVMIWALIYGLIDWLAPANPLMLGLGWVLLTVAFEFAVGRWQRQSWQSLLAAYTFKGGNLWPLVVLSIALAPLVSSGLQV